MSKVLTTTVLAPKGARWNPEDVEKDDRVIPALILVFDKEPTAKANLDNMIAHYGADTVMAHIAGGQSFRVKQQGIWRNPKLSVDQACQHIVDMRAGSRVATTRVIERFIGPEDKEYPTREAAAAAWQAFYAPKSEVAPEA
jgi:hypothetical protein